MSNMRLMYYYIALGVPPVEGSLEQPNRPP